MNFKKHIQINVFLLLIVFSFIPFNGKTDGNEENGSLDSLNMTEDGQKPSSDQPVFFNSANITDSVLTDEIPNEIPSVLIDTIINFNLTSDICYTKIFQFRTKEGKQYFIDGLKNSDELRKLISKTDSLRVEYAKSEFSETRTSISNQVIELENQILELKSVCDLKFMKASELELFYWNRSNENEIRSLKSENDSIKTASEKKAAIEIIEEIVSDTVITDSIRIDSANIQIEMPAIAPVVTTKIIFKVQIGAYNTELPESAKKLYKKISALRKIDQFTDERNYTIYTIGELTNIKDAVKLQDQIRQESIKDAFIVAYKDGKRIPLNEALESTK